MQSVISAGRKDTRAPQAVPSFDSPEPLRQTRAFWGLKKTLCWLAAGALAVACGSRSPIAARSTAARNLVLVTIDTLRADHVGAYGSPAGATPHLDRLASRGVVFENAFTTAPLTLPAHASLLSGLWPFRHGARVNGSDGIAPDAPLLAARLHEAGFATGAAVGSLVLRSGTGLARGFDSYDDRFAENEGRPERDWNARRRGDEVVDRAAAWIGGVGNRRFFLWVHLYDPHAPYDPPPPFKERFAGSPYQGGVAYADACLGRLIAALESRGLLADTLIAVAADHGESLGEHGEATHGVFLYDATLRVPLLLVDPRRKTPRRISAPISLADVAPTFAEAAGLPAVPGDGVSLWPLVAGTATAPHRVYAESVYPAALLGWSPQRALRTADAKYVEAPRPEFYDLTRDPRELVNVFDATREEVRVLARSLARERSQTGKARTSAPLTDRETMSRLASLGYLAPSGPRTDLDRIDASRINPGDRIADWVKIEQAVIARQADRPAEAAAILEEIVARAPDSGPAVWRELALSLRRSGRADRAISVYERIVASPAASSDDFFGLGVCWHLRGRDDRAARAHEEAVRLDPVHTDAWVNLGEERLGLGRLEPAEKAFLRALELEGRSVDGLAGLAAVAFQRKQYAAAEEFLHRALVIAPQNRVTLANLERVRSERSRPRPSG